MSQGEREDEFLSYVSRSLVFSLISQESVSTGSFCRDFGDCPGDSKVLPGADPAGRTGQTREWTLARQTCRS